MTTIATYPSNRTIDLKDPKPEDIRIEDIAWSLGQEGRYSNFLPVPYPVSDHCIHAVAVGLLPQFDCAYPNALKKKKCLLRLLLHDASEAYLRDLPGPLKELVPEYKVVEHQLQRVIYKRFELPEEDEFSDSLVKNIDKALGRHERAVLRGSDGPTIHGFTLDINASIGSIVHSGSSGLPPLPPPSPEREFSSVLYPNERYLYIFNKLQRYA